MSVLEKMLTQVDEYLFGNETENRFRYLQEVYTELTTERSSQKRILDKLRYQGLFSHVVGKSIPNILLAAGMYSVVKNQEFPLFILASECLRFVTGAATECYLDKHERTSSKILKGCKSGEDPKKIIGRIKSAWNLK